jgi:hypothetical protein
MQVARRQMGVHDLETSNGPSTASSFALEQAARLVFLACGGNGEE